jgi:class 3 adenylate cyclase
MTGLIAVWAVSVTLSGIQAASQGWSTTGYLFSYPEPDAYPELRHIVNDRFSPPEAALRPGDHVISVNEHDLRGLSQWEVVERRWFGEARSWELVDYVPRLTATFRYVRAGQTHSVVVTSSPDPYNGLLWLVSFVIGAVGVFVGLRASQYPAARALLVVSTGFGFVCSRFFLGSGALLFVNNVVNFAGSIVVLPFLLRVWLLLPEEAAPRARWPYSIIWVFSVTALVGPFDGLTGGGVSVALGSHGTAAALLGAVNAAALLLVPVIGVRNYRVSGPLGRRQVKWALLTAVVAYLWMGSLWAAAAIRPEWLVALLGAMLPVYLLPTVGTAIAVLRFNLFDIDRVMSATAAFGIAVALLLVVAVIGVPYIAGTLSSALGVPDATGQLLVGVALVALVLPSQRFVRPWVDRTFFRERVALMEGFEALTAEVSAADSRHALLRGIGERLDGLLNPESLVVYTAEGGSYGPVFSSGPSPGEFERDSALIGALGKRSTPLARARGGARTEKLSPFDHAALETLGAEVVLPLRRSGSLDAFVSLGRKHSGDVYTSTDLALLGSLADKTSLKLGEFEGEGAAEERHLAAIVSADVVGYSRLMSQDEQATIAAVGARREIVGTVVREHHGRVVDFVGDAFLAEFPSALDAARFAIQVQKTVSEQNLALPHSRRMEFRVGVHLGDVVKQGERIFGEGVNVAARLEGLAEPGGICVSGMVHAQVEGKLDARYEDLGEQDVKNIPRPVRVYRLRF